MATARSFNRAPGTVRITGGTITSKGVGEMVDRTMGIYLKYFQSAPKAQK